MYSSDVEIPKNVFTFGLSSTDHFEELYCYKYINNVYAFK